MINALATYYAQKYHLPVKVSVSDVMPSDAQGIILAYPSVKDNPDFWADYQGKPIFDNDILVARQGKYHIALTFQPMDERAKLAQTIIDQYLPAICQRYRKDQCGLFLQHFQQVSKDCQERFSTKLRENEYELRGLERQVRDLSRSIAVSRNMLRFYERSEKWLKMKALRMFSELTRLTPQMYESFRLEGSLCIGVTKPITIRYEDEDYHFAPYTVSVSLMDCTISITGSVNDREGHIHPHISGESICWGSVGSLVNDLLAKVELPGLFMTIHQYLSSYNDGDRYLRIENWDPDWEGEDSDNDEWCEWCEESGHTIDDCFRCYLCECGRYHADGESCDLEPEVEVADEQET